MQLARAAGLLPIVFFRLGRTPGNDRAGNIGAVALLAPVRMAVAHEAGVPPFLMALMVACGGNSAACRRLAPTGVIVVDLMGRIGLAGSAGRTTACACSPTPSSASPVTSAWAACAYCGAAWSGRTRRLEVSLTARRQPLELRHGLTLFVILLLLFIVACFRSDVGVLALGGRFAHRAAGRGRGRGDWPAALGHHPMVCGTTTLDGDLERTGGIDLFSRVLVRLSTPRTAPACW